MKTLLLIASLLLTLVSAKAAPVLLGSDPGDIIYQAWFAQNNNTYKFFYGINNNHGGTNQWADSTIPSGVARDSEVTAAIAAHVASGKLFVATNSITVTGEVQESFCQITNSLAVKDVVRFTASGYADSNNGVIINVVVGTATFELVSNDFTGYWRLTGTLTLRSGGSSAGLLCEGVLVTDTRSYVAAGLGYVDATAPLEIKVSGAVAAAETGTYIQCDTVLIEKL